MRIIFVTHATVLAGVVISSTVLARAANPPEPPRPAGAAQQCVSDIDAFRAQMDKEGHQIRDWSTNYNGEMSPLGSTPPRVAGTPDAAEWGYYGVASPRYQIGILYSAANVLADRGDQQGCEDVLSAMKAADKEFGDQLVPGNEAEASWKQQLATAKPLDQLGNSGALTSRNLIGSEVRNDQDQSLGSVSEVVFEPSTNKIAYLVIARGGFLGIGEQHVAVPFSKFRVTPSFTTLVLSISNDDIAKAPEVDTRSFSNPTAFNDNRQKIDQFWQNQKG